MIAKTLKEIAVWCGGAVAKAFEEIPFCGVSTDSRSIRPGELFVPLCGEKFDGHDYIRSALDAGAAAVLSHRKLDESIPAVYVTDTLEALGQMAACYRESLNARVVAITGSVGKTTTKEMLAGILATTYKVWKTQENHNNNIGLPLTILAAPSDTQVLVLELGMNHFGEMSRLTAIAKPDMVVITNIGSMHIEHLGSREGILRAKLEILEGLQPGGTAVFSGDEPLLWGLKNINAGRIVYFGIENEQCDIRAMDVEMPQGGSRFRMEGPNVQFDVYVPAEGRHSIQNALASAAVALCCDVKPANIQQALSRFQNTGMRQKTYDAKGYTIIDDCYNAGPESMEAAILVLGDKKTQGRKIAVLGDMLELGDRSIAEHYRIGRIAANKTDMIFTYGPNGDRTVAGAITGGMRQGSAMCFDSQEELVNAVVARARKGDVLLFKGSRGMQMEKALEMFLSKQPEE